MRNYSASAPGGLFIKIGGTFTGNNYWELSRLFLEVSRIFFQKDCSTGLTQYSRAILKPFLKILKFLKYSKNEWVHSID